MNIYPFIEAEKACRRNVKRACELLKVSRAAFYQHLAGRRRVSARTPSSPRRSGRPRGVEGPLRRAAGACGTGRRGRRHSRKRVARLMRQAACRPGGEAVEEDHDR